MSNIKSVLVTGGAGYVGSILVPKLLKKGYEVVALDTLFFTDIGLQSVKNDPKLKIVKGDIRNVETLKSSLKGIDAVVHLASISNDPSSDLDPTLTQQVNYDATLNLVKIHKQLGGKRFIFASTSSVYGIKDVPNVTEDMAKEPLTIYSKTKAEAEPFITGANDASYCSMVIRPATVCGYSPKMRLDLTINILTMHALRKGKITVFGGGQKRPNIHIEDITDYYIKLLEMPAEKIGGKIYNAGYENHTVMQIAEMVKEIIGSHVQIEVTPTNDNRSYHISSEKIEKELGLKPNHTIKDAVLDIKKAADQKILDWDNPNFYNVKKMKTLVDEKQVAMA
jgi:nucleoside-diphosphate-sugar epimerase